MTIDLKAEKEKRIACKMSTCRYFNGIQNKECRKNINYDDVRDHTVKSPYYPCLNSESQKCILVDCYTREEAKASENEIMKSLEKIMIARQAILKATENGEPYSGTTNCPVCLSGKLSYSIASNGHIHATCSQLDCVRWME